MNRRGFLSTIPAVMIFVNPKFGFCSDKGEKTLLRVITVELTTEKSALVIGNNVTHVTEHTTHRTIHFNSGWMIEVANSMDDLRVALSR